MQIEYLGNQGLLSLHKTAFLCSRVVSSRAILPCYDWATQMIDKKEIVISGFQSKIEKDVLHFLLKGKNPIIVVIARKMYKEFPEEFIEPISAGRMLIVSIAPNSVRVSKMTARYRNAYISQIADKIVFGYIAKDSHLNELYEEYKAKSVIICNS